MAVRRGGTSEGTPAAARGAGPLHDRHAVGGATPPWEIGRPQPAIVALARAGVLRGRVLDVGCGTGEHVLLCASLGLDAVGVDVAATALEVAEGKARDRGLAARFLRHDAHRLPELGESFDTVLDCLVSHAFTAVDRRTYLNGVRSVLVPGGRFVLLGYSDRQPGVRLPHRLRLDDIVGAFGDGWRVDTVEPATAVTAIDPPRVEAWLALATRVRRAPGTGP